MTSLGLPGSWVYTENSDNLLSGFWHLQTGYSPQYQFPRVKKKEHIRAEQVGLVFAGENIRWSNQEPRPKYEQIQNTAWNVSFKKRD